MEDLGVDSKQGQGILFFRTSIEALDPTHTSVRWIPCVSLEGNQLVCEVDSHLRLRISAAVPLEWVRRRGCIGSWWGNRKEGDHWGDLGVDGWLILGWISRRWDVGMWTGLGWPRIGTVGGRL